MTTKNIASKNIVRPDSKGRITLGALVKGVSSLRVEQDNQKRIILIPYTEIPMREKWLFENKSALNQVKKGLQESAQGRVRSKGSFAKFIQDEDD